jgi:hypothetical protein
VPSSAGVMRTWIGRWFAFSEQVFAGARKQFLHGSSLGTIDAPCRIPSRTPKGDWESLIQV